jgi:Ca2+/H+ antiporter
MLWPSGIAPHPERESRGLAAQIVLAVVTLVLPDFTITTGVGTYSRGQSLFAAVVSASLWGIFVFVQTVRHRDYFLPRGVVTLGTGRTSMMQGAVHLVLFATYLFLACVP